MMSTNQLSLPENTLKPKRFSILVPPEYNGGRILILSADELAFIVEAIIAYEGAHTPRLDLVEWAMDEYFKNYKYDASASTLTICPPTKE